jgi:hypothetical protein
MHHLAKVARIDPVEHADFDKVSASGGKLTQCLLLRLGSLRNRLGHTETILQIMDGI